MGEGTFVQWAGLGQPSDPTTLGRPTAEFLKDLLRRNPQIPQKDTILEVIEALETKPADWEAPPEWTQRTIQAISDISSRDIHRGLPTEPPADVLESPIKFLSFQEWACLRTVSRLHDSLACDLLSTAVCVEQPTIDAAG